MRRRAIGRRRIPAYGPPNRGCDFAARFPGPGCEDTHTPLALPCASEANLADPSAVRAARSEHGFLIRGECFCQANDWAAEPKDRLGQPYSILRAPQVMGIPIRTEVHVKRLGIRDAGAIIRLTSGDWVRGCSLVYGNAAAALPYGHPVGRTGPGAFRVLNVQLPSYFVYSLQASNP